MVLWVVGTQARPQCHKLDQNGLDLYIIQSHIVPAGEEMVMVTKLSKLPNHFPLTNTPLIYLLTALEGNIKPEC